MLSGRIRGRLTLPVPNPIYTSQDTRTIGKVFMGYRMLPGEPLWLDTFHSLGDETQGTFALQEALHGFKKGDREAFESGLVHVSFTAASNMPSCG